MARNEPGPGNEDLMPVAKRPRNSADSETAALQNSNVSASPSSSPVPIVDRNATLFVNNIPFDQGTEPALRSFLEAFWTDASEWPEAEPAIRSVRLHFGPGGRFKGHATVEFDSPRTSAHCLAAHGRTFWNGRPVFLAPYQLPQLVRKEAKEKELLAARPGSGRETNVLYVSRLPTDQSADHVRSELEAQLSKCQGLKQIRLAPAPGTGLCRGFAYVEFGNGMEAAAAMQLAKGELGLQGVFGTAVKIAISDPSMGRRADRPATAADPSFKPKSRIAAPSTTNRNVSPETASQTVSDDQPKTNDDFRRQLGL